jgi:hypothetical protein
MTLCYASRCAVAAAILLMAGGAAAADQRIALQVQSKSWIPSSGFDAEQFDRQCSPVGIELVAPASPLPVVATAVVTYIETKGAAFSRFGVGAPLGYGTNISYKLTLLDRKTAKTVLTLVSTAETPAGLPVEQFHDGAREAFRTSPAYQHSCSAIAAALGAHDQLLHLLPWAIVDRQGAALLDKLGFRAETPEQEAYVAVAKNDFSRLRALEAAAVEPLLLLFQNSRVGRDGIGTFPASDPEHAKALTRALAALPPLDDPRIPDVLSVFLNDYSDYRTVDDPVVTPVLVETIRMLGRVGDVFTVPLLDDWQAGESTIARAAQASASALRAKLSR